MTVKILVNENFPAPSVTLLRVAGYDVVSITEACPGIDDGEVLLRATRELRWLVTFDRDYGELVFVRGHPTPPAVILLRVHSYGPSDPAQWVMQLAGDADAYLGKFIVFNGETIRSRPLLRPISHADD
ncbi:MAG: DUF5615 family PIN-like protein [Pseudomonadota bacterium]